MDKSNELFTKLKKRIGGAKLEQILQELDNDGNKANETETAVSFIEEISPPSSSTSKEHSNSSNNNPELYLDDYYRLFLNQAESPLPPPLPPSSPSAPSPPVPVRYYHHQPLPPLQPRKDVHTTASSSTSLLNSPLTTIAAMPTTSTSIAAASPRVSSPVDLTFIAPTLSPLPPLPPALPPPLPNPSCPTPAAAVAHKTTTTTTVSSSPRKNSHPKKISPPKPKKFGIGKNMNLYKRLYDDTSSDNDDDESDEPSSSTQPPVKKYRVKVEYYKRNTSSGLYEIFKTKAVPYLCKTNENIIVYNKKQFEELNLIFEERKNYLNYLENKQEELIEKIKRKNRKKNNKRKLL